MFLDEYLCIRVDDPLPISNVNLMSRTAGFRMDAHSHPFYHINRILDGSVTVEIGGEKRLLEVGHTVVLPPNIPHALYSENGYAQIGIDVECIDDSRGIYSEISGLCIGFLVKKIPLPSYVARESIARMRSVLSNPTKGNVMRAINIAESQILDLFESLRYENCDSFLESFAAMLSKYKPWQLSLADMCRILCTSRTQLERKAKYAFGCGAAEYCARLRYSTVCNLLKSDMTLESIAAQTGFCDAGHLSRFFTSRASVTPGQYRRIIR